MILTPESLRHLCNDQEISIYNARLILWNYIFYKTSTRNSQGKVNLDGKRAYEIFTADITNIPNFEKHITIACNYFT